LKDEHVESEKEEGKREKKKEKKKKMGRRKGRIEVEELRLAENVNVEPFIFQKIYKIFSRVPIIDNSLGQERLISA
jgi:hypothetical protein